MAKLHDALAWAERGYRVFPLAPDSRRPAWAEWDWTREATTDAATIRAWWGAGDWNIGCCAGAGTVVVDLDVKRPEANGIAAYMALAGDMDTLVVRTTTGGLHLYFSGEGRNSAGTVAPGIDTRGDGGYVVAPGSTIDGVAYTVLFDRPLAPLPAEIVAAMGRTRIATSAPLTELDTPAILSAARLWLASQRPAIEGQGGDAYTYHVACELRDRGVSEHAAFEMLLEDWNERCLPPWGGEELQAKVRNAYAYAQNPAGAKAAEVLLGGATITVHEDAPPPAPDRSAWQLGAITPMAALLPRPWLYRRFLMRGEITTLAAAGAAGKSQLSITTAIHLALGWDMWGFKLAQPGQPQNSIIYNAEDSLAEMSRRLYAECAALGVDPAQVVPHIALVSGKDPAAGRPKLVHMAGGVPTVDTAALNLLLNAAASQRVAMLGLDPLVKLHAGLNESDNSHMDLVMEAIAEIAGQGNVAVLLCHHIAKPGGAGTDSYVGNVDAIRGASNITTSSRFAFTLAAPTQDDASRLSLTRGQRERLVRLDDAKMNMALRSSEPVWIEKRTILLPTGDEVGAFVAADMRAATETNRAQMAHRLLQERDGRGLASRSLAEGAAILQDMDPLYSKRTARQVRVRLEAF
ncbi:MAG: bifunctional DNA primase/polymerase, partial [Alphaproteobacteria bacterium]|nr:bifunctional DNA primase/polymerase [Alphaproteobacteria bacterium]